MTDSKNFSMTTSMASPPATSASMKFSLPAAHKPTLKELIENIMTTSTSNSPPSANTLRSIVAVLAGIVVAVASPTLTDVLLYRAGVFPKIGEPMADNLFYLAAAYRLVYSVLGSYVIARLAPNRPMFHAMIAGFLGLLASSAGAVATWNHVPPLGPHWYSLSLVVTALPCAWLGGKLRLMQLSKSANTVNSSAV